MWYPEGRPGRRIVTPTVIDAEQMQGFEPGWTAAADSVSKRKGTRWKLVGNAVTVGVSKWVASRLAEPRSFTAEVCRLPEESPWPKAGYGIGGKRWSVNVSMWPTRVSYRHLTQLVDFSRAEPLSRRAAAGFLDRANKGTLRMDARFLEDIALHIDWTAAA